MACQPLSGPRCSPLAVISRLGRWPEMDTRTHVITGDRSQVEAALNRARVDGRLMSVTARTLLPGNHVRLVAKLRTPAPPLSRWQQARPWLIVTGKVVAAVAMLAAVTALVWGVVWVVMALVALVMAAIAWVHAHLLAIGLVAAGLVALLVMAASSGGSCVGMHCGGCRR